MNYQFALFRILFGSYLLCHFLALIPYGTELFSDQGLLDSGALNLTPSPTFFSTPVAILCLLVGSCAASFTFTIGLFRRTSAAFLWFALTFLFLRNNLISNPGLPYVGLILILTTLIPTGEPLSVGKKNPDWKLPPLILPGATLLLAAGYTFSAWTKLASPSWIDGSAITYVLNNPLARPSTFRDLVLSLPPELLKLATWGALLAELLYLPLTLVRKTRPWIWLALLAMHLGLIVLIDFADLSLGMVMIHLFTFDPKWLPARKPTLQLSFDGDCLMCNRFIHFLANQDQARLITFSHLPQDSPRDSMIVTRAGKHHHCSSAFLILLGALGGHWRALAMIGFCIPRPLRDLAYRLIAANRHRFSRKKECPLPTLAVLDRIVPDLDESPKIPSTPLPANLLLGLLFFVGASFLLSCSPREVHNGRFPFSLMDRPPGGNHLNQPEAAFTQLNRFSPGQQIPSDIRVGDVIGFHMSHQEAWSYLKKGSIQKIPYELFSHGHLALVVDHHGEKRLLQLAMKQAANIDDNFTYLHDKSWTLYRPTSPIDESRLADFVNTALVNVSHPKKAYDYSGALGLHNRSTKPESLDDIASEYTCVTLIQAALHYAGHPTRSTWRKGILDIITPAQLIHSSKPTTRPTTMK
ncbi:MAG: DCC1-like thiol-disulfide oxidoreductase family protein [Verrucomicrobiaceae bacterium]